MIKSSAALALETSDDKLEVNTPSAYSALETSDDKLEVNTPSAYSALDCSIDNLFVKDNSAAIALLSSLLTAVVAALDKLEIAPLISLSADWNAETISVNESIASASTLEITNSTFVFKDNSAAKALEDSAAKFELNLDSSDFALEISAASASSLEST